MKATTFCNNATVTTKSHTSNRQQMVTLFTFLTLFCIYGTASFAQSLSDLQGSGSIRLVTGGISPFTLTGTSSLLNQFTCAGELQFTAGNLQTGGLNAVGAIMFHLPTGDQLVGTVTLETGPGSGPSKMSIDPASAVRLSNGMIVYSTGRFQYSVPDPVVKTVNTDIIGILIGLLVPAGDGKK